PGPATTGISPLSLHDALPISFHPRLDRRGSPGDDRAHLPARSGHRALEGAEPLGTGDPDLGLVPGGAAEAGRVAGEGPGHPRVEDRKSTRLNSSHVKISYAVF